MYCNYRPTAILVMSHLLTALCRATAIFVQTLKLLLSNIQQLQNVKFYISCQIKMVYSNIDNKSIEYYLQALYGYPLEKLYT